jgi:hypothetical protein
MWDCKLAPKKYNIYEMIFVGLEEENRITNPVWNSFVYSHFIDSKT